MAVMTTIVGGRGGLAPLLQLNTQGVLQFSGLTPTLPPAIFLTNKHHELAIVKIDAPLISQLFNYSCISQIMEKTMTMTYC